MTKKRGGSDGDDFDPFDDLLNDDDYNLSSGKSTPIDDDDDDLDIMKMAEEDDDLLDEIERPRRGGEGGGIDLGGLVGGLLQVIITAPIFAILFLAIGGGIVFGGRAVGIIPGGAINLSGSPVLSQIVPSQPAPAPAIAGVPTGAAVQPTSAAPTATLPPTETPIPECRQEDAAAWWEQQERIYRTFTLITPDSLSGQQNIGAYLETLRLQREYSAAVPTDTCTAVAQAALVRFEDATLNRIRILTASSGVDPNALTQAETELQNATADVTAGLWSVGALVEADSPVALGIKRGGAAECGAESWLAQAETIYSQFMNYAGQINVSVQSSSAVNDLITNMQAVQGNLAAVTAPPCASPASQLLQEAMNQLVTVYQSQLAARQQTAAAAQVEYDRLSARYRAWVSWLRG